MPRLTPRRLGPRYLPHMAASHRFVEHTSEVELHLSAPALEELLAEATRALGEYMFRGEEEPRLGEEEKELEISSRDDAALLVDWLNELVYFAETAQLVPLDGQVLELVSNEGDGGGMGLRARVHFAKVPYAPSEVKAATLHGVRVEKAGERVEANVILDV